MRLQLLALIATVATATALPALEITDLHMERRDTKCTNKNIGTYCTLAGLKGKCEASYTYFLNHSKSDLRADG